MSLRIILFAGLLILSASAFAYEFNASDFAVDYSYDGTGAGSLYNNPSTALGRPEIDTIYYAAERPVLPVYAAGGPDEVVTIGTGGYLVLEFDHKVADDLNNPYGVDFIVFGNAWQQIGKGLNWEYGDPAIAVVGTDTVFAEPGIISVSQDGETWYTFEQVEEPNGIGDPNAPNDPNGTVFYDMPQADTFAPTLGRVYVSDPADAYDVYPGWNNLWWGEETNPTLPLDPAITPGDFIGKTVAQVCQVYGESAGGTGFDLEHLPAYESLAIDPETGRRWIKYIKVECAAEDNVVKPEVDAVADVSACGDYRHPFPQGDLNNDCRVDLFDVAIIAFNWLDCTWMCQ